jgi:hypothetical protein
MAHPFLKMFATALKKSTPDDFDNLVLLQAEKLKEKGYRVEEIHEVLLKFSKGIIDDSDTEVAKEALEEFGRYIDSDERQDP